MAIADTIQSMYDNVGEVYDTITNVDVNNGNNLLKYPYLNTTSTISGVTFTDNGNGSITINGTSTSSTYSLWFLYENAWSYAGLSFELEPGTYTFKALGTDKVSMPVNIYFSDNTHEFFAIYNDDVTKTITEKVRLNMRLLVNGGVSVNNVTIYPQINKGNTALPYQPYTDNPTYKNIENIPKVIRKSYLDIMNNGIDTIWNNWEKVEGTGETLTLNSTEEAPMKIGLKGNTSQEGTPTPDYPQDIHVVSGDNSIDVCGKNLFNKDNANVLNAYISTNLSVITANANNRTTYMKCKPNTTYTISKLLGKIFAVAYTTTTPNIGVNFYGIATGETGDGDGTARANATITTGENASYLVIRYTNITQDTTISETEMLNSIQIEKGSSASTYEPYIGNTYNIDLPVENLFDISTNTNGKVLASDGTITDDIKFTISDYIKVSPNTIYTISWVYYSSQGSDTAMRVGYYQNDKTFISRPYNTTSPYVVTTPNNCYYIRICYHLASHTQVQVEKGNKLNSYTPYGTTPIELCKIGNYQDYFGKSTGKNLWHFTSGTLYSVNSVSPTIINENTLQLVSTSNTYANALYLLDLPNGSYTFSLGRVNNSNSSMTTKRMSLVEIVNGTITVIQHIDEGTSYTATIANESGKKYGLRFWATWNTALVNTATFNEIQIEKGTQATTYEPYGEVWYLTKQTSKITFNGSENWGRSGNTSESFFCGALAGVNIPFQAKMGTAIDSKCNYFAKGNSHSNAEIFDMYNGTDYYTAFALYLNTSRATDVTTFKNWLGTHNVILYYVLNTPTYTEITDSTLISQLNALASARSYTTQTNINQENNDLPFILDATALKQLNQ